MIKNKKNIRGIIKSLNTKNSIRFIDKLSFFHIFLIWFLIIIFFGLVYFFSFLPNSSLIYSNNQLVINNLFDAIYFSFVSATTTGFGDIVPLGWFKLISIFEVVCGLLLLAIVTSKLVSIKQNAILEEVYEISFNERINRLRSSLLLFRQNIEGLMYAVEEKKIKHRDLKSVISLLNLFFETLNEIDILIDKNSNKKVLKNIDPINSELILNSILSSFEKLYEFLFALNLNNVDWQNEINLNFLNKGFVLNEFIFSKARIVKISVEKVDFLSEKNKKLILSIKNLF